MCLLAERDMAMTRISKRAVEAARPGTKDTNLWDEELGGFGVKITPTGARTYLIQYRVGAATAGPAA